MIKDQAKVNGVLYRLQYRKCGVSGCKCNTGQGHGPYWYSYADGSAAKYVGKRLPDHVLQHADLLKAARPKVKKLKEQIQDRIEKAELALEKAQRELRTIENLEAGEYAASEVLKSLGLGQFNGQGKEIRD